MNITKKTTTTHRARKDGYYENYDNQRDTRVVQQENRKYQEIYPRINRLYN